MSGEVIAANTPPMVVDEDGVPLGVEEQTRKRERLSLEDNLLALDAAIEHWSDKVTNAADEKEKEHAQEELLSLQKERESLLQPAQKVEEEGLEKKTKSDPQEVH